MWMWVMCAYESFIILFILRESPLTIDFSKMWLDTYI